MSVICRHCATENMDDSRYCSECGFSLSDDDTIAHTENTALDIIEIEREKSSRLSASSEEDIEKFARSYNFGVFTLSGIWTLTYVGAWQGLLVMFLHLAPPIALPVLTAAYGIVAPMAALVWTIMYLVLFGIIYGFIANRWAAKNLNGRDVREISDDHQMWVAFNTFGILLLFLLFFIVIEFTLGSSAQKIGW